MQKRTHKDNDNLARICGYLWDVDRDSWCEVFSFLQRRTGRPEDPLGKWTEEDKALIDYWVNKYL